MIRSALRRCCLGVLLVPTLLVACSDDAGAPSPPAVGAGAAGAGGRAQSGAAGAGLGTSAGAAGAPPDGGGGGSSSLGGASGVAGSGGFATAGSSGKSAGGNGGGAPYPSDLAPGPNVVPTDCHFAHGRTGCCGPDGNAYYVKPNDPTFEVHEELCDPLQPCGWAPFQQRYACGGDADGHPYGLPRSCGAPAYPWDCLNSCDVDADCKREVWGEGVRCYRPHPEATGMCVRCVADADCPVGTFCDPDGGNYCRKRQCATDAQCAAADAALPACSATTATCVACQNDAHCSGAGMGCFGSLCLCKTDAACVASSLGHRCDPIDLHCGCKTSADCPSDTPLCIGQTCAKCAGDEDCAQSPGKPFCVLDGLARTCAACRKDSDCPTSKPTCGAGVCEVGCSSWLDCGGATPVCGNGACMASPTCGGDDDAEPSDDSPQTTTSVLAPGSPKTGKVCGLVGERDHFRIVLSSTSDIALELQSSDARVFVALADDQGRLLALSMHMSPQRLQARALRAGTYYAAVGLAAEGDAASSAYSISMQTGGAPCATDAACGEVTNSEIFRGRCELTSGACVFIEGKGTLGAADPCDDDGDCASGFCSGYAFAAHPSARSRCSVPCDGPTGLGSAPLNELCAAAGLDATWVCTTFEELNRCLPRCVTDDDCPLVDLLEPPPTGQPWRHLTCEAKGHCQNYE